MISVGDAYQAAPSQARGWSIPFASCYAYSPADVCEASRLLRFLVKAGQVKALLDLAIRANACAVSLAQFFPSDAILVPVPGSKACRTTGTSATGRLALDLMQRGLGAHVWFGLRRERGVPKSGTAPPGSRPSVQAHFETLAGDAVEADGAFRIVLVDDVVTKGRTLLAAALRLQSILPMAEIRGFALLRTLGYAPVVCEPLMPCTGTIRWTREDARRNP